MFHAPMTFGTEGYRFESCRWGAVRGPSINLPRRGIRSVYNIIDGMEGDVIDDPASVFQGQRMRNGWKNSGSVVDLRS